MLIISSFYIQNSTSLFIYLNDNICSIAANQGHCCKQTKHIANRTETYKSQLAVGKPFKCSKGKFNFLYMNLKPKQQK